MEEFICGRCGYSTTSREYCEHCRGKPIIDDEYEKTTFEPPWWGNIEIEIKKLECKNSILERAILGWTEITKMFGRIDPKLKSQVVEFNNGNKILLCGPQWFIYLFYQTFELINLPDDAKITFTLIDSPLDKFGAFLPSLFPPERRKECVKGLVVTLP
jgi:hypothetical protein